MACEGSGNTPVSQQRPEGFRAGLETHKVQLSAEQAKQLARSGASVQLIGDYGSFQIAAVDEKALGALPQGVEPRDDFNDILLNAGVIDTASAHGQSLRGMKQQVAGKGLHIVQFAGPIQPEWVKELEATGVKLVTYIPNNAYIVYGDGASLSRLQKHVTAAPAIQWNGDYLNDYKLDPSIQTVQTPTYAIQLIKDDEANGPTLELIRSRQSRDGTIREAQGYVNVVAYLTVKELYEIAARPDVLSIQPRTEPRKYDERQNMIVSGHLSGGAPTGPGWLSWLAEKGFTQAQFTASGFGVDVSDSGMDNGTTTPNHFGFYVGGNVSDASRIVYNRIEGSGTTTQGCDGHGNLNGHIVGGYNSQTGAPFQDAQGYSYGLGVAPFVKLGGSVIFAPDYTDPVYEDLQSRAYRDGMRISTNSWGYTSGNTYNIDCQQYDSLVRDAQQSGHAEPNVPGNQEMVIVFAAGNNGSGANTVAPPGTAKNVITVGASENVQAFGGADQCGVTDSGADSANDIIDFSSRGPSSDGRKKPDIVAPGTHVSGGVAQDPGQRANPPANPQGQALSCFDASGVCAGPNSSNFFPAGQQWYTASSGTSHSTPAVAGGTALVRQYFINQGMAPPSPAMTKAYLMNSARYMTGAAANDNLWSNNQGMGLMDLGMAFDGTPRTLDDQNPANLFTATGQTRTFSGVIADSAKPFRVTLGWTDAPGSTTGSAWKNNLDLTVTVGANTYKGNVFTGPSSVTGGTADGANNVESVFLPAGAQGSYTITITAANINSDGVPGNSSTLDQDFSLVAYNSCTNAGQVPTGVSATANGDNRIDVAWTDNGSATYAIYRSTTAGGPYTQVGTATASPFVDSGVSGGITYYYVVRGVECAESANSTEATATATGACTLPPTFAGLASATNGAASTCANTLTWLDGTPACGGTLSYSVYRGTTAGFTPSASNRIATGISGTSFSDDLNLTQGTKYYYVVRATETSAVITDEANTVEKSATPTGVVSPGVSYFDDLDGNRPANAAAYWIPTTQTGTSGTINITTSCHYQSATKSYRFGATNTTCGGSYPVSTQATLSLGGNGSTAGINGFAIPASTLNPVMSFNLWYNIENQYDGAWLVYSTSSAAGPWTYVGDAVSTTAPYIAAGGYDNVMKNTTQRIWTNMNTGANGALKAVTVNLGALAGQTVWFGFKFSSDITVTAEGVYLDDVRITAPAYGSCTTNVPPPGPAVGYTLTGLPATVQAGVPSTVTLTAVDAVGLTATGYTGTAAFTSSDPQAVLPGNVPFTAGVATGSVDLRTLGAQTLTATDTTNPALTASGSTTVTPGPATALVITTQPSTTQAGASIAPAVKVGLVDQFGNTVTTGTNSVTLALGANPGGGTLSGTTTVTMASGVATFSNVSLDKTGTGYTLVATSAGLTDATSSAFDITPGVPAKLVFQAQPSTTKAGDAIAPAVKVAILDSFDNLTDSSDEVGVVLTTNPNDSRISGTSTVTAVNGVATFSDLSLDKVGTYTLDALSGFLAGATSTGFDITPGDPYRASITRQPSDTAAGAVITPAVQATLYDRFGNVATQATQAVSVSIGNNPTGGTLGGTTTVNAAGGTVSFGALTVSRAGRNYTLVVGGSGLYPDSSVGFDVGVGAPAQLAFTSSPVGNVGSGSPFTVKVEVRDVGGSLVTGASNQVTLALTNASGATLSGTPVATAVNGVATFTGLSVDKAGSGYMLQATASGLTSATSPGFGVDAGAAARLAFSVQPSNAVAGASIAPAVKVSILDAFGNLASSATGSVTLALAAGPSGGTLSGTTTVAAVNGVATFGDLSVSRAGTGYRLTATSGSLTSATSATFDAQAGSAARLVFTLAPTNTTAGTNLSTVSVAIQDAQGNLANATNSITLTLQGGQGGTLSGTTTAAAVGGVATFSNLSIARAGTGYQLAAHANGLTDATSAAFDVANGPVAAIVFTVQPGSAQAGAVMSPAVRVALQDAFGNVATGATTPVTVAIGNNPRGGTLSGTKTVNAINGVATFSDLSINRNGQGYTLQASAGSLPAATSTAFDVTPGKGQKLVFRTTPTQVVAGDALASIEVELRDELDNLITESSTNVTLGLGENPAAAQLLGVITAPTVDGVAKFDGLSLRKAGNGYTLVASAQGFAGATSTAFNVKPGAAASFTLAFVASVTAGQEASLSATAYDAYGNLASDYAGTVNVTSSDTTASFASTAQFVEGVLSSFKVTFKSPGLRTLTVTDTAKAELSSTAQLNVTPFAQPTVSVTDPAGGTTVSGKVSISVTGAVASGTTLAQLSILVDGVVVASGTEATLTGSWDSADVTDDTVHTITAVVIDGAGNVASSAPVSITVHNGGCGCGATSGTDASIYLGLLVLARYLLGRRRAKVAA